MEKIIERLRQIKNEDDFWFRYFANQILEEFDFDYKQDNDLLREQLTDLEQENDKLQEEIEQLEERNRGFIRKVGALEDYIEELENGYDAE
jgi:cell division protein FtsB